MKRKGPEMNSDSSESPYLECRMRQTSPLCKMCAKQRVKELKSLVGV